MSLQPSVAKPNQIRLEPPLGKYVNTYLTYELCIRAFFSYNSHGGLIINNTRDLVLMNLVSIEAEVVLVMQYL